MRKQITFTIEGNSKKFEIAELKVREIVSLLQSDKLNISNLKSAATVLIEDILPICSNISREDLFDFAPSELEEIWKHFSEVNKSFFAIARKVGLTDVLNMLKTTLMDEVIGETLRAFSNSRVDSSSLDTQNASTTDTPIS